MTRITSSRNASASSKMNLVNGKQDSDSDSDSSDFETESDTSSSSESESEEEEILLKHKKSKRVIEYKEEEDSDDSEDDSEDESDDESDDDSEDDSDDDSDSTYYPEEHEPDFTEKDMQKYRNFISKMFPSKYSKERSKASSGNVSSSEEESKVESKSKKSTKKQKVKKSGEKKSREKPSGECKKRNKHKKNKKYEPISSTSSSSSDESDKKKKKKSKLSKKQKDEDDFTAAMAENDDESQKINIIVSLDSNQEDYEQYFRNKDDDEDEEDEDEECNSDDEQKFMKEKYEKIDIPRTKSELKLIEKKEKKANKEKAKQEKNDTLSEKVESEYTELLELKKDLSKRLIKSPDSKILKRAVASCIESIRELVRNARKQNLREYKKLVNLDQKKPNEMNYFKKQLSNTEQLKIMNDLKEINEYINIDKPYRLALLESKIPAKIKAHAFQKLNQLNMMDSCDPEYYKIKNWVDTFMRIPFCNYKSLSMSVNDGLDACHSFMSEAKTTLDNCVYGLDDAKLQIMQMVGQWITNPDAMGTSIAIKGPPGTGKTTLVKDGISKILGREFVFIPLGGTGDASYLEGHSYTYEGSTWGKIVQSLITCGSMNPVFFFDELDKLSDTPKGEEVTGILTHLTDTTQNSQFHDKYFSEIDFDLSKCLFIFSYNDETKVNPILKDRMYRIQTKGYETKEKIVIARDYLLPVIREQVNFTIDEVIITDDTLQYIITSENLTQGESGVRNLKRCLEIIHTKLNLFRLMKPDQNLFEKEMKIEVKFPFTVTRKEVDLFIKNEERNRSVLYSMYI